MANITTARELYLGVYDINGKCIFPRGLKISFEDLMTLWNLRDFEILDNKDLFLHKGPRERSSQHDNKKIFFRLDKCSANILVFDVILTKYNDVCIDDSITLTKNESYINVAHFKNRTSARRLSIDEFAALWNGEVGPEPQVNPDPELVIDDFIF